MRRNPALSPEELPNNILEAVANFLAVPDRKDSYEEKIYTFAILLEEIENEGLWLYWKGRGGLGGSSGAYWSRIDGIEDTPNETPIIHYTSVFRDRTGSLAEKYYRDDYQRYSDYSKAGLSPLYFMASSLRDSQYKISTESDDFRPGSEPATKIFNKKGELYTPYGDVAFQERHGEGKEGGWGVGHIPF